MIIAFQFIISPKSLDKKIKLQLPIMIATYPLRDSASIATHDENGKLSHATNNGTMSRHGKDRFPTILPIYRPNPDTKPINNNRLS